MWILEKFQLGFIEVLFVTSGFASKIECLWPMITYDISALVRWKCNGWWKRGEILYSTCRVLLLSLWKILLWKSQCPNMLKQLVYGTFLGLINLQFLGLIGPTVSLFYEFFGWTMNVNLCLHTAMLVQTVLMMSRSNIRNILNEFQFVYSFWGFDSFLSSKHYLICNNYLWITPK